MLSRLLRTTALYAPEGPGAAAPAAAPEAAPAAPAEVAPAPVAAEPAAPPAAEAAPAAAPAEAAPAAAAPEPEKPAEPAKEAEPAKPGLEKPSLLTEKPPEPKVDAKPGDKPAEAAPAVEAAAEPKITYETFKFPEGLKTDDAIVGKFSELAATHKLTQEQAQAFMDVGTGALKSAADAWVADQWRTHNEMRQGWRKDIETDKEFGGNQFDTSRTKAARMIETLVPKNERKAFDEMLDTTGAGDHPQMFRFLQRIAAWLDEPVAPKAPEKPAANNGKPPGARGLRSMYVNGAEGR